MPQAKPHLNIITLGQIDNGKTTLTAAITKVLAKQGLAEAKSYEALTEAPKVVVEDGLVIHRTQVTYQTQNRQYTQTDCSGHSDIEKYLITSAVKVDSAILVVSAFEGPMPQTMEHLKLAHEMDVQRVVVFLNKIDLEDDTEQLDLCEMEIGLLLNKYGFSDDQSLIIRGSASKALLGDAAAEAQIQQLLDACDKYFQTSILYPTNAHEEFECMFYLFAKHERGRKEPIYKGHYRPHFCFGTTEERAGECRWYHDDMIRLGDKVFLSVKLISPIAMAKNQCFKVREGGRTVGIGRVIKIIK